MIILLILTLIIFCHCPKSIETYEDEASSSVLLNQYHRNGEKSIRINFTGVDNNSGCQGCGRSCNRFNCFDPMQCHITKEKKLLYYIYPPMKFVGTDDNVIYSSNSMMTREYLEFIESILTDNDRATIDPTLACFFIPSIDMIFTQTMNESTIQALYSNLPYWYFVDNLPGTNHLRITLNPSQNVGKLTRIHELDRSILISPHLDSFTLRPQFDINIPSSYFNAARESHIPSEAYNGQSPVGRRSSIDKDLRNHLATSAQFSLDVRKVINLINNRLDSLIYPEIGIS